MFVGWVYMLLMPGLLAPSGSSRWWLCLLPGAFALTFVAVSNPQARRWVLALGAVVTLVALFVLATH